jgi:hypothetical protein
MLIVNDEQRLRAGIGSLSKRCQYCCKALAAYPVILSDDARLAVYHAACAVELATEIMVDLYTFLSPPAPYHQLFVLTPPGQLPLRRQHTLRRLRGQVSERIAHR